MLNVFVRAGAQVRHFWGTELRSTPDEPAQHNRCADFIWPLWNLLDVRPEGRGTDPDFPSLRYPDVERHP